MEPEATIKEADRRLRSHYGTPRWEPSGRPVEGLVRTILSQNTSDANSGRAFAEMMERFGDLERVRTARPEAIARAIRAGGLANVKSVRIKRILGQIHRRNGGLSLEHLRGLRPKEALAELESFDGVGPKTSHCVLLFDLGVPVFPVDTHILRVTKRLNLVPQGADIAKAHAVLAPLVPGRMAYRLHRNLIAHGRRMCRPTNPSCADCPIFALCEYEAKETA